MVTTVSGANQIQPADNPAAGASPKLVKAAHEFEAILLQNWMEKMNQGLLGDSGSLDPAHDTVKSLGTQAIATALSARGGIGIARMILRQLAAKGGTVPGSAESPQGAATHQAARLSR
jgi:Rod binding domain-containing protein